MLPEDSKSCNDLFGVRRGGAVAVLHLAHQQVHIHVDVVRVSAALQREKGSRHAVEMLGSLGREVGKDVRIVGEERLQLCTDGIVGNAKRNSDRALAPDFVSTLTTESLP